MANQSASLLWKLQRTPMKSTNSTAARSSLVGADKAMVIDTGSGIGDLRGVIANITDKPIVLVITHAHGDHVGGLGWFDDYYMNKEDVGKYAMEGVDFRRQYAGFIAQRSGKGNTPITSKRISAPGPQMPTPVRHDLEDGQTFDLGGGRIVTAMRAPGHTPGSMVLIDPTTRILFAGDACNCNTLFGSLPGDPTFVSVETAGKALKDIYALKGKMWISATTATTTSARWARRWPTTSCPT